MHTLVEWLAQLPLEWFTLLGSFTEELLSPMPSFMVFLPAGASLQAQGGPLAYLLWLGLLAGAGHTVAALILYGLANKFRGYLYTKRTKWLGVSRKDIEAVHKRLQGRWSWWLWFGARAIPFFPGAPLSVTGGFVRAPLVTYTSAAFLGSSVNAVIYMYIGYMGLRALAALQMLEVLGWISAPLLIAALVVGLRHYVHGRNRLKK
jgi:membrane protein DedA with SNARE-associated domain